MTEPEVRTLAQRIDDFERKWEDERRRSANWLRVFVTAFLTVFLAVSGFTVNEWVTLREGVNRNANIIEAQQDVMVTRRDHEVRLSVMESQFSRIERVLQTISTDIREMRNTSKSSGE